MMQSLVLLVISTASGSLIHIYYLPLFPTNPLEPSSQSPLPMFGQTLWALARRWHGFQGRLNTWVAKSNNGKTRNSSTDSSSKNRNNGDYSGITKRNKNSRNSNSTNSEP